MGSEMRAEDAAHELDQKLRVFPWYISIGVGRTANGPALFLYVKSARHRELQGLKDGWRGFPVLIRPVGSVRPVSATAEDDHSRASL
jgi:hypothetical protein